MVVACLRSRDGLKRMRCGCKQWGQRRETPVCGSMVRREGGYRGVKVLGAGPIRGREGRKWVRFADFGDLRKRANRDAASGREESCSAEGVVIRHAVAVHGARRCKSCVVAGGRHASAGRAA